MSSPAPTTQRGNKDDSAQRRRGTGRTHRGRAARTRLIAAARRIFERDGFLQARIADICQEAGLSQPSFYTYFHSKAEVFHEVVGDVDFELLTMPRGEEQQDPIARLRAANRHYLEFYRDNAAIIAVIDQVAAFDADMRTERFRDSQERFALAIERRIRKYQDAGLADPRVDPHLAAMALGNMVTATASALFVHGFPAVDFDHVVDQLTLLWANAIGLAHDPGEHPQGAS